MLQETHSELPTVDHLLHCQQSLTSPRSPIDQTQAGKHLASPTPSIDVECGEGSSQHTRTLPTAAAAAAADGKDVASGSKGDDASLRASQRSISQSPSSLQLQQQQQKGGCCSNLPFAMLMHWYWAGVLLQFLFEAWVSCSFYTLTTWFPAQMSAALSIPLPIARGMLIVNLLICVVTQLCAGHASDKGMPRLWSAISVYIIAGAIIAPILLFGMRPHDLTTAWLTHALLLALVGWVLGIIPAACSPIYPAAVRTTGFNLAHNM
jgi:hypothetical protein